jgi:hypothetical protein
VAASVTKDDLSGYDVAAVERYITMLELVGGRFPFSANDNAGAHCPMSCALDLCQLPPLRLSSALQTLFLDSLMHLRTFCSLLSILLHPCDIIVSPTGWFSTSAECVKCQFTYMGSIRHKKKVSAYDDKVCTHTHTHTQTQTHT